MVSPLDLLLSRLEGVHRVGEGYRANCPLGHRSKGTLSISEADDGRVLLKDWAGHTPLEIMESVGLTLGDLFPQTIPDYMPHTRKAANVFRTITGWAGALSVLGREATVVAIAARVVLDGDELGPDDVKRLAQAIDRIEDARTVLTP